MLAADDYLAGRAEDGSGGTLGAYERNLIVGSNGKTLGGAFRCVQGQATEKRAFEELFTKEDAERQGDGNSQKSDHKTVGDDRGRHKREVETNVAHHTEHQTRHHTNNAHDARDAEAREDEEFQDDKHNADEEDDDFPIGGEAVEV